MNEEERPKDYPGTGCTVHDRGDGGGALGAALEVAGTARRAAGGARPEPARDQMRHALLGSTFGTETIRDALDAAGLAYEEVADPAGHAARIASALSDGQVVGLFDGAMEFGPRALDNRSILADLRGPGTQSRVNRQFKFREDWRPFAPIVVADRTAEFFEPPTESPYMLLVADLKPTFRGPCDLARARSQGCSAPLDLQAAVGSDFDAVTHVDFCARLQTMDPSTDPRRCAAILAAFEALTGCPMLLNTSVNVRGEPIVCTPEDAVACFLDTHIDLLAIGPFLVHRSAQKAGIDDKIRRRRFAAN